jgi:predicted AlkP superfamily pyrophosphatase or phosphodiesterase
MTRRLCTWLLLLITFIPAVAQDKIQRPKLVVGIVIDQMRWDYLYRYWDRYDSKGGFKRLLNQGFSCENTLVPYAPTITACGHSCIYTGSVPAISGITGNLWWDREKMRTVYCVEDKSVNTVGSNTALGQMSPRNMLVTSVCDELRLATNFKSKVIGIAIKDRGGILPAGHSANAAYWYDVSVGNWISSTYYMNSLPTWVTDFNNQKNVDKYYQQGWNLMYPANTYQQSTADLKPYEGNVFGTGFPYDLKSFAGKDYTKIASTPMGNTMTLEFAKAAIQAEQLGMGDATDFLAVSCSSTDYIGHAFGPNSMEAEDGMLKLDKDLGNFLDYLDAKVGKGQYLLFLSADHGVTQTPEFMQENKLPAGRLMINSMLTNINKELAERYKLQRLVVSVENYQVHLDHHQLDSAAINTDEVIHWLVKRLYNEPAIDRAFALSELNEVPLPATIRKMINNGYYPRRSGDIQIILKPGYIESFNNTGTTHGLWNPYDAHIPLLWYGWGIKHGASHHEVYMTDIAPTVAALLHIQMPSGCVGQPIEEVFK